MIVFDKEGQFLNAWGEDIFTNPHGIYIDADDHLFCADNFDHTVRKLTTEGEVLMTLGDPEKPAETGFRIDQSPVCCSAGPFNMVTNAAVGPEGDLFITDGYGNGHPYQCLAHRYPGDGKFFGQCPFRRKLGARSQRPHFNHGREMVPETHIVRNPAVP